MGRLFYRRGPLQTGRGKGNSQGQRTVCRRWAECGGGSEGEEGRDRSQQAPGQSGARRVLTCPGADTGRGGGSQADRGSGRKARPALTLAATHASPPPAGAWRSGSETHTVGSLSQAVVGAQQALPIPSHHVGTRGRGSCRPAHGPRTCSAPCPCGPWVPRSHWEQTCPRHVPLAGCPVGLRTLQPPCFRKRFPV